MPGTLGVYLSFSCTLSHLFCMLGLPSSLRKRIMRSFSPIKRYARGLVNFLPWWPACPGLLILRPFCVPSGNAKGLGGRSIITVKPRNYCCFALSLKFLRAPLLEFKFFVHGHINLTNTDTFFSWVLVRRSVTGILTFVAHF